MPQPAQGDLTGAGRLLHFMEIESTVLRTAPAIRAVGGYIAFFLRKLSVIAGIDAACGDVPVRSKLSESVSASGVSA